MIKKLILDEFGDIIGLGSIKMVENDIQIFPIVDLGEYLRSEDSGMFKH
jgi:ribosome biogenesis protein Nip4